MVLGRKDIVLSSLVTEDLMKEARHGKTSSNF
jgi:hypothetical protein